MPEAVRRKYEASATHQEIYAGAFDRPDAPEHVVAFIREMRTADGRPLREASPHDAALRDFVDLKQGGLDRESQEQLVALKRKLRDNLGAQRVKTYPARWKGHDASTAHVAQLCADLYRALRRLIHAQIQRHRLPDKLPPHVRLIVSVAEAGSPQPAVGGHQNDCLTMLRGRLPAATFLPLQPMRPDDATELFQKWLAA